MFWSPFPKACWFPLRVINYIVRRYQPSPIISNVTKVLPPSCFPALLPCPLHVIDLRLRPKHEQLSLTLFSIIGGFWLLDSLKDTVLEGTVGLEYQPRAKLLSVAVTLLLVIQYNRLVDSCSKPTVSYSYDGVELPEERL